MNPWQITRVFLSIQTLAVDDIILFSAAATACLAAARENLEEDASTMVIMKYIYTNDGFCIPLPVLVGWEVDCRCSGCTGDDGTDRDIGKKSLQQLFSCPEDCRKIAFYAACRRSRRRATFHLVCTSSTATWVIWCN